MTLHVWQHEAIAERAWDVATGKSEADDTDDALAFAYEHDSGEFTPAEALAYAMQRERTFRAWQYDRAFDALMQGALS